jgi:aspartate aminotransferase-like enzyme
VDLIKKYYLLSPGPTPVPEDVLAEATRQIIHHRTPEFSDIFMKVLAGLKYVFQTKEDVYTLASSGTGAMEAAVVNTLTAGDKIITVNGGKFGGRWGQIGRCYGADVRDIEIDWGQDLSRARLEEELNLHPDTKAVFTTLAETSTGTVYDIKGFGDIVSKTKAILVVDGISGIGATPCPMDEWKVDVLISASQKSFMTPPGLAYIAFSPKAWENVKKSNMPKYYFDALKYKEAFSKQTSPYTPATSLLMQQNKALDRIRNMGLKKFFEHHRILGEATREAVRAIGLELLSSKPGNILTAVKVPEGIDGIQLLKIMHQKYKAYIAGAQDPHKGEFFRIAHLGYMGGFDIITALSALEMTLDDLDYKFQSGTCVKTAEKILKENWE